MTLILNLFQKKINLSSTSSKDHLSRGEGAGQVAKNKETSQQVLNLAANPEIGNKVSHRAPNLVRKN